MFKQFRSSVLSMGPMPSKQPAVKISSPRLCLYRRSVRVSSVSPAQSFNGGLLDVGSLSEPIS